jgi:hypothetical protein
METDRIAEGTLLSPALLSPALGGRASTGKNAGDTLMILPCWFCRQAMDTRKLTGT